MDELLAEHILAAAEAVPRGCVVSYGDIAELVGTGPRHVGAVLRRRGAGVPWWRVTNASGEFPAHLRDAAREAWAAEGIVWTPNGRGCSRSAHRPDPSAWADAYAVAVADLPPRHPPGPGPGR